MRRTVLACALALFISILTGSAVATASPATYVVKSGDCLWTISNATGVSVDTIKQLNGLTSDFLQVGQTLKLSSESSPGGQEEEVPVPAADNSSVYVVCSGDSLWSIAMQYGITVDNIKALNGLTTDMLYVGESLIVTGTAVNTVAAGSDVSRSGSNATGDRIVAKAAEYLGTPYRYGGASPGGFDCSGFTSYIFSQFGISLYRTAAGQYGNGVPVSKGNLIAGDLVFFACYSSSINHVGIYVGNGRFIHSSSPSSGGVIYSALNSGYYAKAYVGATRVIR